MQLNHSQSIIRADAGITSNCCSRFIMLNPAFPVYLVWFFFLPSLILTKTAFRNSPQKHRRTLIFYSRSSPEEFCECVCVCDLFCTGYFKKKSNVFARNEAHITRQHQEHLWLNSGCTRKFRFIPSFLPLIGSGFSAISCPKLLFFDCKLSSAGRWKFLLQYLVKQNGILVLVETSGQYCEINKKWTEWAQVEGSHKFILLNTKWGFFLIFSSGFIVNCLKWNSPTDRRSFSISYLKTFTEMEWNKFVIYEVHLTSSQFGENCFILLHTWNLQIAELI